MTLHTSQSSKQSTRAAIFMDYENFFNSLKKQNKTFQNVYGFAPKLDFIHMVDYIEREIGQIAVEDFIVVANFSHYDGQKGGLNKVSTQIHVDSFEDRITRKEKQRSPGKKYVIDNFADARLAYEIGYHAAKNSADIYIIASGDKFFLAPARALRSIGVEVYFLVSDVAKTAIMIKQEFPTILFTDTQPNPKKQKENSQENGDKGDLRMEETPVEEFCNLLSNLRQGLRSGIPSTLILSFYPFDNAKRLLNKARGEGIVDVWESEIGVQCVSLQNERLYNTVQKVGIREGLCEKSEILYMLRIAQFQNQKIETLADWRKALMQLTDYSNREIKRWLQKIQKAGILHQYDLHSIDFSYENVMQFIES
ncbi:MAG: NYN domain-containing protein [Anaerolineaceae bacterium]|nr:NYN domain-containing protein [Anaerolineaceae bacterium]